MARSAQDQEGARLLLPSVERLLDNIRLLAECYGEHPSDLLMYCKVGRANWFKWAKAEQEPSLGIIERIAEATGVPVALLFGETRELAQKIQRGEVVPLPFAVSPDTSNLRSFGASKAAAAELPSPDTRSLLNAAA